MSPISTQFKKLNMSIKNLWLLIHEKVEKLAGSAAYHDAICAETSSHPHIHEENAGSNFQVELDRRRIRTCRI